MNLYVYISQQATQKTLSLTKKILRVGRPVHGTYPHGSFQLLGQCIVPYEICYLISQVCHLPHFEVGMCSQFTKFYCKAMISNLTYQLC